MPSSRDRLEDMLSRLAARAGRERVFARLYPDAARAAADAADARRRAGVTLGPLDGRIVSIKDLFDGAGEPTAAGSLLRASAAPAERDALAVTRLRRAGAVILGKTAMTEFAFHRHRRQPAFRHAAQCGGCFPHSGRLVVRAGVSVAEGTSEIAIGSDTGGSVRIPAALNGTVGFKPTARRVPLAGAFPLSPTLDSIGPLARSVADCAAADAVMAGEEWAGLHPVPLAGLRVGVPRGRLFEHMEDAVGQGFERCLAAIGRTGAHVAEAHMDDLLAGMREATRRASIAALEGAEVHADWLEAGPATAVDPHVSGPLARAATAPAPVYIRALRRRADRRHGRAAGRFRRSGAAHRAPAGAPDRGPCRRRDAAQPHGGTASAQHAGGQPVRSLRHIAAHAGHGAAGRADAGGAQRPRLPAAGNSGGGGGAARPLKGGPHGLLAGNVRHIKVRPRRRA